MRIASEIASVCLFFVLVNARQRPIEIIERATRARYINLSYCQGPVVEAESYKPLTQYYRCDKLMFYLYATRTVPF